MAEKPVAYNLLHAFCRLTESLNFTGLKLRIRILLQVFYKPDKANCDVCMPSFLRKSLLMQLSVADSMYSMNTALSVCVLPREANTMQTIVATQPVLYAMYIATQWGFWSSSRVQNSGLVVVEEWRFHWHKRAFKGAFEHVRTLCTLLWKYKSLHLT